MVTTIPTIDFNEDTVEQKNLIFTVWDVGGPVLANAMTAAEATERLGLQKEIVTRNMNSVEADLTTGIDAAVSQRSRQRSSSRQHSKQSNLLGVKQIYIGLNKMKSGSAGSKQEKFDEFSNEMKSMLIKICWTKDFIEKNIRTYNQPKQLERRSARRTALPEKQVLSLDTKHVQKAGGCNHVDLVWTTTRH